MDSDLIELMEEPAGGHNHGRRATEGHAGDDGQLDTENWQDAEFMRGGGWTIVDTNSRAGEAGMSAHRGILHPDEYVDSEALRALVENELGFTYAEVHSVFRRGPVAGDDLVLRSRIDARVLQIQREGGNLVALGRALGFGIDESGRCKTLSAAVARALSQEDGSWD